MGGRYPPELEYRKTDWLVGFSCPHSHGSVREGGLEAFHLEMLYVNAGRSKASRELTRENQESFRVGHVHGICGISPGLFPIVYSWAAPAITTVLLGWTLIFVGIALTDGSTHKSHPHLDEAGVVRSFAQRCWPTAGNFPVSSQQKKWQSFGACLTGVRNVLSR